MKVQAFHTTLTSKTLSVQTCPAQSQKVIWIQWKSFHWLQQTLIILCKRNCDNVKNLAELSLGKSLQWWETFNGIFLRPLLQCVQLVLQQPAILLSALLEQVEKVWATFHQLPSIPGSRRSKTQTGLENHWVTWNKLYMCNSWLALRPFGCTNAVPYCAMHPCISWKQLKENNCEK